MKKITKVKSNKKKKTSNASEIIQRRYYQGKPKRVVELKKARLEDKLSRKVNPNKILIKKEIIPVVDIIPTPIKSVELPKVEVEKILENVEKEAKVVEKEVKAPSVNKMYFTADTELAVAEYNIEQDMDKRNKIYNEKIKYPFEKLVENVFNTFKFTYFDTSPLNIQKDVVGFLVSVLHKFDSTKGSKAYSYFSVVAKHYLIALNNGNYKRFNQHVDISDEKDENTIQLQSEDKYYKKTETEEFMSLMVSFWENNVNKIFTKPRDLEIANAVIELFRNSDRIEAYNKKALYLYIREISQCKTQQITKVINKMKQYQNTVSRSYINDGIVNVNNYIKS